MQGKHTHIFISANADHISCLKFGSLFSLTYNQTFVRLCKAFKMGVLLQCMLTWTNHLSSKAASFAVRVCGCACEETPFLLKPPAKQSGCAASTYRSSHVITLVLFLYLSRLCLHLFLSSHFFLFYLSLSLDLSLTLYPIFNKYK